MLTAHKRATTGGDPRSGSVSVRGGRRVTPMSGKRAAQALTVGAWIPDQESTSR
jgi:hypothetical protein